MASQEGCIGHSPGRLQRVKPDPRRPARDRQHRSGRRPPRGPPHYRPDQGRSRGSRNPAPRGSVGPAARRAIADGRVKLLARFRAPRRFAAIEHRAAEGPRRDPPLAVRGSTGQGRHRVAAHVREMLRLLNARVASPSGVVRELSSAARGEYTTADERMQTSRRQRARPEPERDGPRGQPTRRARDKRRASEPRPEPAQRGAPAAPEQERRPGRRRSVQSAHAATGRQAQRPRGSLSPSCRSAGRRNRARPPRSRVPPATPPLDFAPAIQRGRRSDACGSSSPRPRGPGRITRKLAGGATARGWVGAATVIPMGGLCSHYLAFARAGAGGCFGGRRPEPIRAAAPPASRCGRLSCVVTRGGLEPPNGCGRDRWRLGQIVTIDYSSLVMG